jgi:carboxyl-terminal processing protease
VNKDLNNSSRDYTRSLLLGALVGVGLALVFSAGFFLRDFIDVPQTALASSVDIGEAGYPLVDEVEGLLERHYLRELPDYRERQYAAVRGMLASLEDPNTFFIDPPVARSESDVLAGTYGGIGVSLQRDTEGRFVLYPFEDGPAAKAGLQGGDVLIEINGEPLSIDTQQDAVDQMLRGEVDGDNGVEVTIEREGDSLTEFIEFDVIAVPSVLWRVLDEDQRIGYMQILRFTSRTPDELQTAITELRDADVNALIIDLRDNSGGLLTESVDVASIFLDGGVVLYEVTNNSETTLNADQGGAATDLPLAVLVNNRTASASELVAGALQDRERAVLIGQQTFGKGTIQQIFPLSDESSVHVTSAEWFTPNRNALDRIGLEPDIPMIPDENGRDVEIGEAIRYLQANLLEEQEEETNS